MWRLYLVQVRPWLDWWSVPVEFERRLYWYKLAFHFIQSVNKYGLNYGSDNYFVQENFALTKGEATLKRKKTIWWIFELRWKLLANFPKFLLWLGKLFRLKEKLIWVLFGFSWWGRNSKKLFKIAYIFNYFICENSFLTSTFWRGLHFGLRVFNFTKWNTKDQNKTLPKYRYKKCILLI